MMRPRALRAIQSAISTSSRQTPSSWTCQACLSHQRYSSHQPAKAKPTNTQAANIKTTKPKPTDAKAAPSQQTGSPQVEPPDHRKLGLQQQLFITSPYSPGSPIFLPHGARIFNRLVDFLRRQYVRYGFREVITPTIYKKSLWAKSGHLENYAEDMYSVTAAVKSSDTQRACCGGTGDEEPSQYKSKVEVEGEAEGEHDNDDDYGLKPMNCPGHCLIFASQTRSYRDLPIRYADFSPLHRNEPSGSLSGLTRVRRFHQDDGHIFCRPCQVEDEIRQTLDFIKAVYGVLRLGVSYRLALSTRPLHHFIGTEDEWRRAEDSLRRALEASGMDWSVNEGDGAFYGPKIDVILKDSDGKEHQTATIQLDFQLPKRFGLEYQAPAPQLEAIGETTDDTTLLAEYGPVQPVMIHRAVLGSVERLMALLIETYNGKWPFWLNPRQVIILTVNTSQPVVDWANRARNILVGIDGDSCSGLHSPPGFAVVVDASPRPLGAKIREARADGHGQILIVGEQDAEAGQLSLGKERLSPAEVLERMRDMANEFL